MEVLNGGNLLASSCIRKHQVIVTRRYRSYAALAAICCSISKALFRRYSAYLSIMLLTVDLRPRLFISCRSAAYVRACFCFMHSLRLVCHDEGRDGRIPARLRFVLSAEQKQVTAGSLVAELQLQCVPRQSLGTRNTMWWGARERAIRASSDVSLSPLPAQARRADGDVDIALAHGAAVAALRSGEFAGQGGELPAVVFIGAGQLA